MYVRQHKQDVKTISLPCGTAYLPYLAWGIHIPWGMSVHVPARPPAQVSSLQAALAERSALVTGLQAEVAANERVLGEAEAALVALAGEQRSARGGV